MSTPSIPEDDEAALKSHATYVHKRLADMLVKQDLSPYSPMPDKVELNHPSSPFSAAVNVIITAAHQKTPDPKLDPSKKSTPKRRR